MLLSHFRMLVWRSAVGVVSESLPQCKAAATVGASRAELSKILAWRSDHQKISGELHHRRGKSGWVGKNSTTLLMDAADRSIDTPIEPGLFGLPRAEPSYYYSLSFHSGRSSYSYQPFRLCSLVGPRISRSNVILGGFP
ncbi:hypothetical protein BJX70DRAFT_25165 [Aspergillus crustosus]